ncbi:gluconokinase [soil metagenome]
MPSRVPPRTPRHKPTDAVTRTEEERSDAAIWVLALDIGTSSVRAVFYDREGRAVPPVPILQLPCRWEATPDGGMAASPAELLALTLRVIDAALDRARDAGARVAAVATAAFWHSLLALGRDGTPLTPVFGWGDTRAAGAADRLRERLDESAVHRRTGCFFHPSYPAAKLLWLQETAPDLFRGAAAWMGFGEYLALRLFGEARCSLSMASGMGLLDLRRLRWDVEMLDALHLPAEALPPLADTDAPHRGLLPEYARRWPELAEVPWLPALGDGACANVGSGAIGRDRFALTVGTSAAMRALWDTAEDAEEVAVPADLWCYRLDRRRLVAGRALSNGGNIVAALAGGLRLPPVAEWDDVLAAMEPDAHGLTVLPFLLGERSPQWRLETQAALVGAAQSTTPVEVARACLEAVAYRIGRVYSALEGLFGPPAEILAGGGALHASPLWTQIIADVLGRPLTLASEEETTSRGAALMALEQLGLLTALQEAPRAGGREFFPDPARHDRYRAARERQRELETLLLPWLANHRARSHL